MRLLILVTGEYGYQHVKNIRETGPREWGIRIWQSPRVLPSIIDYPEEYCPDDLPLCDLILSLTEVSSAAQLIPEIAKQTKAQAVIAPIDNTAWLPAGLANQLQEWLTQIGVACVTPKPFCSLTETTYNTHRYRQSYEQPLIQEFATHFGRPLFDAVVQGSSRKISELVVRRDACCGCARYVADQLQGAELATAVDAAGLHHHHYPCQASMGIDQQLNDTLMHVSGNILKDAVRDALKPYLSTRYISPDGHVDRDS